MPAPEGEWEYNGATFTAGGEEVSLRLSFSGGTSATVVSHTGNPEPGTYENVSLSYIAVNGDTGTSETLTIPIPRLVVAE